MITVDGSIGEGGGQILRTSLALSLTTGKPFHMVNIRTRRKKAGLLRQHLTALKAAAEISRARVMGHSIGSSEITFEPGKIAPGEYLFSVETAGSATLVLQTVFPALMTASGTSRLVIEGGTHNKHAPPFDFIQDAFIPCVEKMGPEVTCVLNRPGFYPAGGGKITVNINPCRSLKGLHILERGEIRERRCTAVVSKLNPNIGYREIKVVVEKLNFAEEYCRVVEVKDSLGPGNILVIEIACEHITEVFTGFGEKGVLAEHVAENTVKEVRNYLATNAPVGKYLADQLLLPLAMAGEGMFRTLPPSLHTLTNMEVIKQFVDINIDCRCIKGDIWEIAVKG